MEDQSSSSPEPNHEDDAFAREPRLLRTALKSGGLVLLILVAFAFGYVVRAGCTTVPINLHSEEGSETASELTRKIWTCSMHPQIRRSMPGSCPLCGMDLIPVPGEASDGASPVFTTSPAAFALMDIQTSPVERRYVTAEIRMVGKIDYDESRLVDVTAKFPGRLDRLFADYTGMPVQEGQHMVEIYSPELITAQEELFQAIKARGELEESKVDVIRKGADDTVVAVREKLRLWGLTAEQIDEIERRGETSDHVTLQAPASGVLIHKHAQEGRYVKTGDRIYTVADLSRVWARLDAYESDLVWLRYGQDVEVVSDAYPEEIFMGKIAIIDPVLNDRTRTVKVRVNLPNRGGRLKPAMFVRGIVRPKIAAGGRVIGLDLAGKWMCPMHPEVVKDVAAACDICGMDLVTSRSLGYHRMSETDLEKPLVIPATAPLITGVRAIVYVKVPYAERPTFEGREVALGPRAGNFYIVNRGLTEGEEVVTRGSFKIDSALQIQARESMMLPRVRPVSEYAMAYPSDAGHEAHTAMPDMTAPGAGAPTRFQRQLTAVFDGYLAIQSALTEDDLDTARDAAASAATALDAVDMTLLSGKAHMTWMGQLEGLRSTLESIRATGDMVGARATFKDLSKSLEQAIRAFGLEPGRTVYVLHCPMAFGDEGADWLQDDKDVRNPYFGSAMLKCGEVTATLVSEKEGAHRHE